MAGNLGDSSTHVLFQLFTHNKADSGFRPSTKGISARTPALRPRCRPKLLSPDHYCASYRCIQCC